MFSDWERKQRDRVQKSIEKERYCKVNNLCRRCMKNEPTTHDQLFTPICQECRDYLEYGITK